MPFFGFVVCHVNLGRYNSVFEILQNDVRSKETHFHFLPLTYKRRRKIDLSSGDLVTDFCRFFANKAAWSSRFFTKFSLPATKKRLFALAELKKKKIGSKLIEILRFK